MQTLYRTKRGPGFGEFLDREIFKILRKRSVRLSQMRGQRMAVFANDYIGNKVNLHGFYELDELNALSRFLSPIAPQIQNGAALDIGANIGNHAIFLARMFKEVHAFEPNPFTFKLLDFNTSFSTNIRSYSYGLSDQQGEFELFECFYNHGKSSIKQNTGDGSVMVPIKVLDDTEVTSEDIVLMKIDVEGLEENVLSGAERTIEKHQPVIVFEQHRDDFLNGTTDVIAQLSAKGYRMCWFEGRPDSTNKVRKLMYDAKATFFGAVESIVSGDKVPAKFHNMLIAVPPRFQKILGVG